ncbi:MAG: hypothetical protein KME42_06825 [Tildeniella nuda ZEHNDER 1965/U140]|nr:hypothetical protein [Tildeniella nuda ZEHNDER 1965/U140]
MSLPTLAQLPNPLRIGICKVLQELRSTLEDWIVVGLKLGHPLPILNGIDLNREITRELMDTL